MTEELLIATADQLIAIVGYPLLVNQHRFANIRTKGSGCMSIVSQAKPLKNQFNTVTNTDPMHVHEYFQECIDNPMKSKVSISTNYFHGNV
jgi:hypothetical protein